MMFNALYDVFFVAVSEGRDVAQVKLDFAQLFRVEVARVDVFFNGDKRRLRAGVDEATADKYIDRLASLGVIASKVAAAGAGPEQNLQPADSTHFDESGATDDAAPVAAENTHRSDIEPSGDCTELTRVAFRFSGGGFEYFKIWIVNILLSVLTLGIYSAWAKVRNKQYFYGNTFFANSSFEYTAQPLQILKGRIIAVALFIVYTVCSKVSPMLSMAVAFALLALLPWIIVNSLRFNARHSSYRNINFRFLGTIGGAAKTFLLWPLVGVLSLGILLPFAWKKQMAYITNNHSYGAEPFEFDVSVKAYYKLLLGLVGIVAAFILLLILISVVAAVSLLGAGVKIDPAIFAKNLLVMIPIMMWYVAFYVFVFAFLTVKMANIHFNNTVLQKHHFQSGWLTRSYAWLLFTNTLGILLTLGLFIPFARVRTAAYKAEHTSVLVSGNLDSFIAGDLQQSNALGEGMHDIFDIDISF